MGRVGDDDGGGRHSGHHALAAAFDANLAQLGLDRRIAFHLLVLVLDLLNGHALLFHPLQPLEQIIERCHDGHDGNHAGKHLQRQFAHQRQQLGDFPGHHQHQPVAFRPDDQGGNDADNAELDDTLGEVHQAFCTKKTLHPFFRRNLGQLGFHAIGREDRRMLDDIPDQRSKDQDRQGRQQNTEHRAADIEPDLAQVICNASATAAPSITNQVLIS